MNAPVPHHPVMLDEVLSLLAPRDGGIYIDGTFGAGGYARAVLDAADCAVWGIDRDWQAVARAATMERAFDGRLVVIEGRFSEMNTLLAARGVDAVDGVALDLGVSSMQLEAPERGFSFRLDGPLDMRMGRDGPTAADLVNSLSEAELSEIIYKYGEERSARRIARAIVKARTEKPITRTLEFAELVRAAGPRRRHNGLDPATRTFQALRIAVNDELGEIKNGLATAERLLRPMGRLAVVAFHSLEDRAVKEFLRARSGTLPGPSRHQPPRARTPLPTLRRLTTRALRPSAAEIAANPRARSARLRAGERIDAAAAPHSGQAEFRS